MVGVPAWCVHWWFRTADSTGWVASSCTGAMRYASDTVVWQCQHGRGVLDDIIVVSGYGLQGARITDVGRWACVVALVPLIARLRNKHG